MSNDTSGPKTRVPRRGGSGPPTIKAPRRRPPAPAADAPPPAALAARGTRGQGEGTGNRKLIRPALSEHVERVRTRHAGRRRVPPPEQAGAEAISYARYASRGTPLIVLLETGDEVRGVLEWHDRDAVKVRRPDGSGILVMKQAIVHSRPDAARGEVERRARRGHAAEEA